MDISVHNGDIVSTSIWQYKFRYNVKNNLDLHPININTCN